MNSPVIFPFGIHDMPLMDAQCHHAAWIPRWPYRASYRSQIRDGRRRRNVAKRGGAR